MFSGCAFVVRLCCGLRNNGSVTLWNLDWCVEFIGKLSYRGDSVKSGYCGASTRTVIAFHVLWALLSHCIPADAQNFRDFLWPCELPVSVYALEQQFQKYRLWVCKS